jgi:hypothetical protein
MRRPFRWLIATVGALLVFAVLPAAVLADGPRPIVESESASNITESDATLEAQINPGSGEDGFSLETTYEFFLESPWCGSLIPFGACEASGGKLVYKGVLPAGSAPQLVSVDLASVAQTLTPDTTYGYRVVATNEAGEAFRGERTFTTLPGKAPVIGSVSISHLTPTDATLEANINTEGLRTTYEFHMWSSPCSKHGDGCELIMEVHLPCCGRLFGSFEDQTVSLDLNSAGVTLGGGEYGWWVTADNGAGETEARGETFEAPPGVVDPLAPGVQPLSGGGGQPPLSNNGDQSSGSTTTPAHVLHVTSPLGGTLKTGTSKQTGKHKHGHKHKHHGKKTAKVKKHKR